MLWLVRRREYEQDRGHREERRQRKANADYQPTAAKPRTLQPLSLVAGASEAIPRCLIARCARRVNNRSLHHHNDS